MSNKHKHYDLIVAKAANMDLVIFSKNESGWRVSELADIICWPDYKYFLCLPQHKESCLHWLNGGALQDFFEGSWTSVGDFEGEGWVEADNMFMNEEYQLRIKPKKEKRWIVIHNGKLVNELFKFDTDIRMSYLSEYETLQRFEIEVEV
jgi:hypothetical protein